MTDSNKGGRLGRRRFLQGTSLIAGGALAAPAILKYRNALAQDKPAELIVRAWGGVWVESLAAGRLGAVHRCDRNRGPPRPDRGQRDPAQDLGGGRSGPGAADPHQLGHHHQRHQVGAPRRDRGSRRSGQSRRPAAAGQAHRPRRLADRQHLLLRLRPRLPRRGLPGRSARQLAGDGRSQVQGTGRHLRRRHRLPSGGPDRGRRHASRTSPTTWMPPGRSSSS